MPLLLGAHVESKDPLAEAAARSADVVQIVMASPRTWFTPKPRRDAEQLRAQPLPIFTHSPYLINFGSADPEQIRKSTQCIKSHADASAAIGASGLVVHGGHVTGGGEPDSVFDNWRALFQDWTPPLPILIENQANGQHSATRTLEQIDKLWSRFEGLASETLNQIGFCFDTCHAHAGGLPLVGAVEAIVGITGKPIALVHVNDSRDAFDSRRDRHEHLGRGQVDPDELVAAVIAADAPSVVETADGAEAQAADIAWLREQIARATTT